MNRDKLAEILVTVSDRVKEHWRIAWESSVHKAQASGRSAYNPYSDNNEPELLPAETNSFAIVAEDPAVAVANRDDVCGEPGQNSDDTNELL